MKTIHTLPDQTGRTHVVTHVRVGADASDASERADAAAGAARYDDDYYLDYDVDCGTARVRLDVDAAGIARTPGGALTFRSRIFVAGPRYRPVIAPR
jgi:hypothetical protein